MPGASLDGAGSADDGDPNIAELLPHEQLTHIGTMERKLLPALRPGHRYELDFDEQGFGLAVEVDAAGEQVDGSLFFLEDTLKYSFYEVGDGSKVIATDAPGGAQDVIKLRDFGREARLGKVAVVFGPGEKRSTLEMGCFRWPRGNNKLFLSMPDLYTALCLNQFGGQSSRWIYNGRHRWQKFLDSLQLPSRLQVSSQVGKSGAGNAHGVEAGGLPLTALSLPGLVALLDRFALRQERACGLRDAAQRLNARWFLEALLCACATTFAEAPLELDMSETWENRYPHPKAFRNRLQLVVGGDGVVDMRPWRLLAQRLGPGSFAHAAWQTIPHSANERASLLHLLTIAGDPGTTLTHSIFKQLIHDIGDRLHGALTKAMHEGGKVQCLEVTKVEVQDAFSNRGDLDCMLVRYKKTAEQRFAGLQYWTGCSDKSAVGGFTLQATMFVANSNVAVIPPPAVPRGTR